VGAVAMASIIPYPTDGVYDLTFAEVSATSVEEVNANVKYTSPKDLSHVI
jgi:hypothetical protein